MRPVQAKGSDWNACCKRPLPGWFRYKSRLSQANPEAEARVRPTPPNKLFRTNGGRSTGISPRVYRMTRIDQFGRLKYLGGRNNAAKARGIYSNLSFISSAGCPAS
jgi:hypothetical protein